MKITDIEPGRQYKVKGSSTPATVEAIARYAQPPGYGPIRHLDPLPGTTGWYVEDSAGTLMVLVEAQEQPGQSRVLHSREVVAPWTDYVEQFAKERAAEAERYERRRAQAAEAAEVIDAIVQGFERLGVPLPLHAVPTVHADHSYGREFKLSLSEMQTLLDRLETRC